MKILRYIIAGIWLVIKSVIFLLGLLPLVMVNFSTEYIAEWKEMVFGTFYIGRNNKGQIDSINDFVNKKIQ